LKEQFRMNDEIPIACTLTGAQTSARLTEMAAIGHDSLLGVDEGAAWPVLRFRAGEQTRTRLVSIMAAESQCCAFLDLDLTEDFQGLALTISGPEGAAPIVQDLVAAFRDGRAA
jgi:hypothetical protein